MTGDVEDIAARTVSEFYRSMAMNDTDAVLNLAAQDVRVVQSNRLPWGGVYHGRDGLARFAEEVRRHVSSGVTVDRLISSGDRVAAVGTTRGTTVANGRAFELPLVHLFTVAGDRIASIEVIVDVQGMLDALS